MAEENLETVMQVGLKEFQSSMESRAKGNLEETRIHLLKAAEKLFIASGLSRGALRDSRKQLGSPMGRPRDRPRRLFRPATRGVHPVKWKPLVLALLLLLVAAGGAYISYRTLNARQLPPGFLSGNGRIEANEIDVAAKYAARIATVHVQEGDLVEAGAVLATLDTRDLEAQLHAAEAQARQAVETRAEADSTVAQRASEAAFAAKEMERALVLFGKGHVSQQRVDQARNQQQTADAALAAAQSRRASADEAIAAANAEVERIKTLVADGILTAPRTGRVLYRLAEPGEVLGAGGKVVTLLDLSNVYMTFFLPTDAAGPLGLGADARLVLDALPDLAIPAMVSFVSPRAQFTPKQVETKSERDRMMFRVKARIPEALVTRYIDRVKTGVTGMAYVRLDDKAEWPGWLESRLTRDGAS